MPVTITPSAHGPNAWSGRKYGQASSPESLLSRTLTDDSDRVPRAKQIVQSSFVGLRREDGIFATKNGFVHTCIEAYNNHHNLVIRPEDVWFAILVQLSSYVNAHSEDLRGHFFDRDGQEPLHLHLEHDLGPELNAADHGKLALQMTKNMQAHIKDQDLQKWILPAFTTTTKVDQAVASVIFMGTMQKFFTYSWGTKCGIPKATLLGQESDWIRLRDRATRLSSFGKEPAQWARLLQPTLDGFISSFREPDSESTKRFWQGICNEHVPNGSGTTTYSGWITSFCYWDEAGNCIHRPRPDGRVELTRGQLPIGFTRVPVTLLDRGQQTKTELLAGSMAIRASKSSDLSGGEPVPASRFVDTIQPEVGWFIYKT